MKQKSATPTKPSVVSVEWKSGFAMGVVSDYRSVVPALRSIKYKPAFKDEGRRYPWGVEAVELAEDKKTLLRIVERRLFKTEAEAKACLAKWSLEITAKQNQLMTTLKRDATRKVGTDEQDMHAARQKVLREQYPNTFKALDALPQPNDKARPDAIERSLKAFTVDTVRLHKPSKLDAIKHFQGNPDLALILEIAKAHKAKSPIDPVDCELAAYWLSKGYDKMSRKEYTRVINAKTGANLTPEAMERRRYAKLGLMTKKLGGPPTKV